MYSLKYCKPKTIFEAVSELKNSDDASLPAGGHTLIPTLKQCLANPHLLIDLAGCGLSSIIKSAHAIEIGAMTCHADVAKNKDVAGANPGLSMLARGIGDRQVRNCGTIGGSLANNDPAADYPSACLALNATIHTNKRKIPADKFFKGMFETDLKKGELIEAIEFEVPEKSAYSKYPNPASRYAVVGVYIAKLKKEVRVAVTGAGSSVFRSQELESALSNNFSPAVIDKISIPSKNLNSDIHASAEYRAHLIKVMAKKSIGSC